MQKVRTLPGEEQVAKGMVWTAGQGARGRPLTRDPAKPMAPTLGRPVMAYLMEQFDLGVIGALAEHKAESAIARVVALDVPLGSFEVDGVVLAAPNEEILSLQEKSKPPPAESALASTDSYIVASKALNPIRYLRI